MAGTALAHFTETHLDKADHKPGMPAIPLFAAKPADIGDPPFQLCAKRAKVVKIIRRTADRIFHNDAYAGDGMVFAQGHNVRGFSKTVILINDVVAAVGKALLLFNENTVAQAIDGRPVPA